MINAGMQTGKLGEIFGTEELLKRIRSAGFGFIDFNIDAYFSPKDPDGSILLGPEENLTAYFKKLKAFSDSIDLRCSQAHAPMPSYMFGEDKQSFNEKAFAAIARSFTVCDIMEAPYLVVHPPIAPYNGDYVKREDAHGITVDFYTKLIPYSKKYGVGICLENMFDWNRINNRTTMASCGEPAEFAGYIDELNGIAGDSIFSACLDVGHVNLSSYRIEDFVYGLGNRISILHVHDNDGVHDMHTCPRTGTLKWGALMKALRETGFDGVFSLEASGFIERMGGRLMSEALEFMYKVTSDIIGNEYGK